MPKFNLGSADRVLRIAFGMLLVALPLLVPAAGANVWLLWGLPIVGVILVITGAVSWCPIYAAFGLSSRSKREV